jgi:hypothetical protein
MHKLGNVSIFANNDARSRVHCCSGKAISITYSECVSVASGIQHAMRMRHNVIYDLSGTTIFFSRYLPNGTIFERTLFNKKVNFDLLYKFCLKHFSF